MWKATLDHKTCRNCKRMHGKIYWIKEVVHPYPPLHPFCRCVVEQLESIRAGLGTKDGTGGADIWLKINGHLPNNYITVREAMGMGWNPELGNLSKVAPGKMIMGGVYQNRDGHLPDEIGRIWYEADINYKFGFRGHDRIVFSNDGLIFVTYDHYKTFIEIV